MVIERGDTFMVPVPVTVSTVNDPIWVWMDPEEEMEDPEKITLLRLQDPVGVIV